MIKLSKFLESRYCHVYHQGFTHNERINPRCLYHIMCMQNQVCCARSKGCSLSLQLTWGLLLDILPYPQMIISNQNGTQANGPWTWSHQKSQDNNQCGASYCEEQQLFCITFMWEFSVDDKNRSNYNKLYHGIALICNSDRYSVPIDNILWKH
jgi:hypothetical protein